MLLATTEPEVLANIQEIGIGECFTVVFSEDFFLPHLFNHLSGQRLSGIWLITFPRLLQELDFCVKGFISVDEIFAANDGEFGVFFL